VSAEPTAAGEGGRQRPSEVVAGYLAAISIFTSLVSLAWHPLRLCPFALLLALVATAMSGRSQRLPFAAVVVGAACFFLGLTIAVTTQRPLW